MRGGARKGDRALARRKRRRADPTAEIWVVADEGGAEERVAGPMPARRARALAKAATASAGTIGGQLVVRPVGAGAGALARVDLGGIMRAAADLHATVAGHYDAGLRAPVAQGPMTRMIIDRLASSDRVQKFVGDFLTEIGRAVSGGAVSGGTAKGT